MPEIKNEEKNTIGNEQKPNSRKLSIVKDNYTIHSSFEDDDSVFNDTSKKTANGRERKNLVLMKANNQIKELQTVIWNRYVKVSVKEFEYLFLCIEFLTLYF